ncbi:C45 family autoproteolytic acyltransferase/hydolase [Conexibacter arvalis]|uniref:Isopenicillin-N N-acyltransferase-like protein n=1 Tax=Conexibacter arvalis TaxID=912552 RepID=A0A840IGQ2_9ACTN|nr:isopenicillin-N N-acyltransferase-like protein [Conexibacter arvalis]
MGAERFAYPIVTAVGDPRERGRQYGAATGTLIERNLRLYEERFRSLAGLGWREALRRAEAVVPTIGAYDRDALEELRGIAEGAGQPLAAVAALNCRTELLYPAPAHECTTVGVLAQRSAEGHVLLGQNWDWLDEAASVVVLLRSVDADGFEVVSLHEAGQLARAGCNSAGVGAVGNFLESDRDRRAGGVPLAVIARRILHARSLADAVAAIAGTPRAVSNNYLLASAQDGPVDIEATPREEHPHAPCNGLLVHANHFHAPCVVDTYRSLMPDSFYRESRMQMQLGATGPVAVEDLMRALRDHVGHPDSICRHLRDDGPQPRSRTLASTVIDLTARQLWIADGNPCERPYLDVALDRHRAAVCAPC